MVTRRNMKSSCLKAKNYTDVMLDLFKEKPYIPPVTQLTAIKYDYSQSKVIPIKNLDGISSVIS